MKYTNDGNDERVYPTLGVILEAGKSFDDQTAIIETQKILVEVPIEVPVEALIETLSAPSDIIAKEVK